MLIPEMSGRASSPVLVGRDEQMAALEAAFASVRQGGPSAVLLGGEAGVGKSRLIGEFSRSATSAGARVLTGGCLELGVDGLPFAPFTSVLRELVRDLGADGVAELLPGGAARELARLLPEFGEPAGSGGAGEARARLYEQMLILLEQLAECGPDDAALTRALRPAVRHTLIREALHDELLPGESSQLHSRFAGATAHRLRLFDSFPAQDPHA